MKRFSEAGRDGGGSPAVKRRKQHRDYSYSKLISLLEDDSSLIAGLTYFLKVAVSSAGDSTTVSDVISEYVAHFPECAHLWAPLTWEKEKRTFDVLLTSFKCLEQVLLHVGSCPTTSPSAASSTAAIAASSKYLRSLQGRLVQRILTNHLKCLYHSMLSTVPQKLTNAGLRLLVAMVMTGAESAKEVQMAFNFGYKPLSTFPHKTTPITDSLTSVVESVRQSYMRFALSFLLVGDPSVVMAILELKGFLSSFFNLLPKDDSDTITLFLTTIFEKVVKNSSVSKKTKSLFFSQFILKQVAVILSRGHTHTSADSGASDMSSDSGEETGNLDTPSSLAYMLLLTLCTDFQLGICYKPKAMPAGLGKTNNPVLLHFMLSLTGQLSNTMSWDIIFRTLSYCPDLILMYIKSLSMNFEPRPSSVWIANITFLTELYDSFVCVSNLLNGDKGNTSQPPPSALVGVAVGLTTPLPVTRSHLSLGLQHPLPLLKYHTLWLLSVVLNRAQAVLDTWGPINRNLASVSSFLVQYSDAVLKCLPDIRTLVSLYQRLQQQQKSKTTPTPPETSSLSPEDRLKNTDLASCSTLSLLTLSVLSGYQKLSPDIFVQINFNPAKLLPPFPSPPSSSCDTACDPQLLVPILQLNANAHNENWNQNGSAAGCVFWLTQSSDKKVSEMACLFVHKILLSGEQDWIPNSNDPYLFLSSLSAACDSSACPEHTVRLVELVAGAVTAALLDRHQVREEVREVLGLTRKTLSLQEILESAELDLMEEEDVGGGHTTAGGTAKEELSVWRLVLISCLLSQFNKTSENDINLFRTFICHFLTRCILTSDPQGAGHMTTLITHHAAKQLLHFRCSLPHFSLFLDPVTSHSLAPHSSSTAPFSLIPELEEWVLNLSDSDEVALLFKSASRDGDKEKILFLIRVLVATLWKLYSICESLELNMETEVVCALWTVCGLVAKGVEFLAVCDLDTNELQAIHNLILDPKFVKDMFLNCNKKPPHPGGKKKKKQSHDSHVTTSLKDLVGSEYNLRLTELVVLVLEKFGYVLSDMPEMLKVAMEKLKVFVETTVLAPSQDQEDRQAVIELVTKLCPYCAKELVLLAGTMMSEVLREEKEGVSISMLSRVLKTILIPEGSNEATPTLRVCTDDSFLINLLTLASRYPREDLLVDIAYESLVQWTLNSPIVIATSPGYECGLVTEIKCLTRALPGASRIPTNKDSLPLYSNLHISDSAPFHANVVSIPDSRTEFSEDLLSALMNKSFNKITEKPSLLQVKPLTLPEQLFLKLLGHCGDCRTLPLVKLVLLICKSGEKARHHFESLLLPKLCDDIASGQRPGLLHPSLYAVARYCEGVVNGCGGEEGKDGVEDSVRESLVVREPVKLVCEVVTERCVEVVFTLLDAEEGNGDAVEERVEAGIILRSIATLNSKARKGLKKHCKKWLKTATVITSHQVCVLSVVAVKTGHANFGSLLLSKTISSLKRLLLLSGRRGGGGAEGGGKEEEEEAGEEKTLVQEMCRVLEAWKKNSDGVSLDVAAHLEPASWNKFLLLSLKSRFTSAAVLHLLSLLLPTIYGSDHCGEDHTPLEVVYDMIWSHSEFMNIMCSSCDPETKEGLVELLVSVVKLEPSVCKDSHMLVFLGAYSATRSKFDRGLLYLMTKYEENGVPAGEFSPFLWGRAALEHYRLQHSVYWRPSGDPSEALRQLDTHTLQRTINGLSPNIQLKACNPFKGSSGVGDSSLYDPCFLLPLLSHALETDVDVDCQLFVARGCLGVLVVALSSLHKRVREAAGHTLSRFRVHLEKSKFKEKAQVVLLMDVLQNTLAKKHARLPSIFGSFAAKTCNLLMHAESPVYPVVTLYLVYKPALNLRGIPLLFTMLHSSSPESVAERVWLYKVLLAGLKHQEDYSLYKKHKLFSHLSTLAHCDLLTL